VVVIAKGSSKSFFRINHPVGVILNDVKDLFACGENYKEQITSTRQIQNRNNKCSKPKAAKLRFSFW